MKIAVIGCGYVGKTVAQKWQQAGLDLLVTTTSPERVDELNAIANQVAVLKGTEAQKLEAAIADREVVLLCVGSKRGASYRETYLSTAETLAKVLPNTTVQHLIYTSSCSIYGQTSGAWINETMPPDPTTENGKIIEATEQTLMATTTPQRKICILRLGGIYGPGRTLTDIYGRVAGTTRPGKGEGAATWVHLDDIVGAIDWVRQQRLSGIYNLVQDEVLTRRELIDGVCDRNNLAPVAWDGSKDDGRERNIRLSNQKLKSTGYVFMHPSFWP